MIAGVLLAAGRSQRMGQSKLLLPWHGVPLVRYAAQIALRSKIDELLVVVGHRAEHVKEALDGLPVRIVPNNAFLEGQSTSIRAGIAALDLSTAAVLILLADQPLIQAQTLDMLIEVYRREQPLIVAPRYKEQRGNPVLFARTLFPQLLKIAGDEGARAILKAYAPQTVMVDVADEGVVLDIDTPQAYRQVWEHAAEQ
jgi:molybdenum cofactor cytidylyltransferase